MADTQSFKNHTRWQPIFHFFTLPILLANVVVTIVVAVRSGSHDLGMHVWLIFVAAAILIAAGLGRGNALKAQDRVIRLEERMRLASLVSASEMTELDSLTMRQYVGLRFASNTELPDLARRAIREHLTEKQIKEAIVSWRADNDRV